MKRGTVERQMLVWTLVHVVDADMVARSGTDKWLLPAWVAESQTVEPLLMSLRPWSVGTSLNRVGDV